MRWLLEFSHYIGRDLYLTGESYGGHYIPHIAKQLWDNRDTSEPRIPFKGFAIGNPWTDPAVDYRGEVDFWYSRALISTETYAKLTQNVREAIIAFVVLVPMAQYSNGAMCRVSIRTMVCRVLILFFPPWQCGVKDYWEDVPGSKCLEYLTQAYQEMVSQSHVIVIIIPSLVIIRSGMHVVTSTCSSRLPLFSLYFSTSPFRQSTISSFRHFVISPFRHFSILPILTSPSRLCAT